MPTLATQIELACVLEATVRKPGNVHPGAAFSDLRYDDFVRAAAVSAPILARAHELGLGRAVYDAVSATRAATGSNVNLGICLMLAPLAAGAATGSLWDGARRALAESTVADTEFVYRAIRLAQPGGMGQASDQDISAPPTLTIPEVMALAADRDDVARELSMGFRRLEQEIVPVLVGRSPAVEQLQPMVLSTAYSVRTSVDHVSVKEVDQHPASMPATIEIPDWERSIIVTHLRLIAEGDTLIRRKCGDAVCREASRRATEWLSAHDPTEPFDASDLYELDTWLRADGHRRNPGTSADLIAAALFAALVKGRFPVP